MHYLPYFFVMLFLPYLVTALVIFYGGSLVIAGKVEASVLVSFLRGAEPNTATNRPCIAPFATILGSLESP